MSLTILWHRDLALVGFDFIIKSLFIYIYNFKQNFNYKIFNYIYINYKIKFVNIY